eukprot:scaffold76294_cov19-Tisochrysis_lutea.AAC.1
MSAALRSASCTCFCNVPQASHLTLASASMFYCFKTFGSLSIIMPCTPHTPPLPLLPVFTQAGKSTYLKQASDADG